MDIVIYGIPEEVHRCYGCVKARSMLEKYNLEYEFRSVIVKADNDLGFSYDRELIKSLASRLGQKSLSISYPKIFVDGKLIGGHIQLESLLDTIY